MAGQKRKRDTDSETEAISEFSEGRRRTEKDDPDSDGRNSKQGLDTLLG